MSTDTHTQTDGTASERRSRIGRFRRRIRSSEFFSELLSNPIAVFGLAVILTMAVVGVYARVFIGGVPMLTESHWNSIFLSQVDTNPVKAAPSLLQFPPSFQHPFGTDGLARDVFQRSLYGAWIAMKWGTIVVGISTALGVGFGLLAAYYSDITDNIIMRTMDVLLAFPSLLLALALVAILGNSMANASIALILVYTPRFARVVRGTALKVLEDEFIDATIALGASDPRVLVRHVLPNCLAPITVQSTLNFGLAIIDLAALSYLGFGAAPGTPSWGMMLQEGAKQSALSLGSWWWAFFPGVCLALTVLGFNLLGDGMRDALDPRMREAID